MLKILKKILGIVLIIIGVIGLFLPIIQGVLLIIAGLLLLGVKKQQISTWFKKLRFWKKSELPTTKKFK